MHQSLKLWTLQPFLWDDLKTNLTTCVTLTITYILWCNEYGRCGLGSVTSTPCIGHPKRLRYCGILLGWDQHPGPDRLLLGVRFCHRKDGWARAPPSGLLWRLKWGDYEGGADHYVVRIVFGICYASSHFNPVILLIRPGGSLHVVVHSQLFSQDWLFYSVRMLFQLSLYVP